eukprot:2371014-Pyramimonas_sp.AAC.1
MAGNYWNRFRDIRRVCLRNLELRTCSVVRIGSAKLFVLLEHPERCCRFPSAAVWAAGLVITEIDSETSDASASHMQRSELALILELALPNYSYCSSHLERYRRFTHVARAVGELQS